MQQPELLARAEDKGELWSAALSGRTGTGDAKRIVLKGGG